MLHLRLERFRLQQLRDADDLARILKRLGEGVGAGAAVGVLALLGAVWFGRGEQVDPRRAAPAKERGVRLAMLRQEEIGGGGGAAEGDTVTATDYALMTT